MLLPTCCCGRISSQLPKSSDLAETGRAHKTLPNIQGLSAPQTATPKCQDADTPCQLQHD